MSSDRKSLWQFEGRPTEAGWYPVLMCWELEQGTFPAAAEFPFSFNIDVAVVAFGPRCQAENYALAWAFENLPDV